METEANQLTPRDRYLRDPMFRALVDQLRGQLAQCNYTATELREAAILAAQIHADHTIPRPFYMMPGERS